MNYTYGEKLKLTIFGESHARAIGGIIEGLPAGTSIDEEALSLHMMRRAPGRSSLTTKRAEKDKVEILSGCMKGKATGTPLGFIIENQDTRSADYEKLRRLLRPGHADYTAYAKYKGFQDYRGSGGFSGRITAPLHFAGGIAMQMLKERGIMIFAHILSIGQARDHSFAAIGLDRCLDTNFISAFQNRLQTDLLPTLSDASAQAMEKEILSAQQMKDSVGGVVECGIFGIEAGVGGGFFSSVESRLASLCFSIPAVKGIEFGAGFEIARMKGSEANDIMRAEEEIAPEKLSLSEKLSLITHESNCSGGIIGGITNGMPVVFRCAVKPPASIAREQRTVDIESMRNTTLHIEGRHDPSIVPRLLPVLESATAFCIMDLLLSEGR